MDDNRRQDPLPDNTAATIIPSYINTDDEILSLYGQNTSQVNLTDNPQGVSHHLPYEHHTHPRPQQQHYMPVMADRGRYSPLPSVFRTPSPSAQRQPSYGQGHPPLGNEQMGAGMDRFPSPNFHQPREGRLRSQQTSTDQPHDRQRQGRGEEVHLPRYQRNTDSFTGSNLPWEDSEWQK